MNIIDSAAGERIFENVGKWGKLILCLIFMVFFKEVRERSW